jgi:hypothetical protein
MVRAFDYLGGKTENFRQKKTVRLALRDRERDKNCNGKR